MEKITGYKVFENDWTCRGFQYEVGKDYFHYGNIELCDSGFHFCRKASDCFNYYSFDSRNKVAIVEVVEDGLCETGGDKSVTNHIRIVKELNWNEVLEIVNEGKDNTGNRNTGNRNTGDRNTGNRNTGDWNTGNCNIGDWNTGDWNTGDRNTGNKNTGNKNTGDWNTIDFSSGLFNTIQTNIIVFNKPSNITLNDWYNMKAKQILNWNFENSVWIYSENMTNEEKKNYPTHETTGGYLKVIPFEEACNNMWNNLTEEEKSIVQKTIPNFDKDVFKEITGIKI